MAYDYIVEVDGTIDLLVEVEKFNPYHDRLGRFTTASGASSFTVRTKNPEKQHLADRAIERVKNSQNQTGKSIDACKTVGEVEELMKSKKWFHKFSSENGEIWDGNKKIDLSGCDLESAKGVYSACDRVFTRLPEMVGQLNAVSAADLGKKKSADCFFGFGRGGITLNTRYFGDHERNQKKYDRAVKSGFSPKGTNASSIVVHEFGHAVDDYLTNILELAGKKGNKPHVVSSYLRSRVMRSCGKRVGDIGHEVSDYATKSHYEWFAECFAEWIDSPNPRPVAKEFGKQLLEIIRGEG